MDPDTDTAPVEQPTERSLVDEGGARVLGGGEAAPNVTVNGKASAPAVLTTSLAGGVTSRPVRNPAAASTAPASLSYQKPLLADIARMFSVPRPSSCTRTEPCNTGVVGSIETGGDVEETGRAMVPTRSQRLDVQYIPL